MPNQKIQLCQVFLDLIMHYQVYWQVDQES